MIANGPRPLLNSRALIALQTPLELRADQLLQAANTIDGLDIKEWNVYEGLNDIVLNSDRVSMKQIDELNQNLSSFGYEFNETDIRLTGEVEQTRSISGAKAMFGGNQPDTTVVLEIPASDTGLKEIRNAFGTSIVSGSKEINAVNVTRQDRRYVIEPNTDVAFLLSGTTKFHWNILNQLGVDYEDAVYAASVVER